MGDVIRNYTLEKVEHINEIDAKLKLYKHDKTQAKIVFIENEDPHKTFGIAFRTPPNDSTGIAHIIEHSVLCGSRKYPLKDPFVELAKGSLNTYLNAMTYPDKTLYPISSQNDADFHNLMDVYLDAVFFPKIYESKNVLMQEGWRYHIEDEQAPLEYKGVVYNEMKGAFSAPEEVLFRKIKEVLFPDTIYANESGGAPDCITELTYEDFIGFHKKYYHPSNSYIWLYGDVDIEKELDFIDKEYLSHFNYEVINSAIPLQASFKHEVIKQYPYSVTEKKDNQLFLSYNCVVGESTDQELLVAMGILEYLLLDTPAAPLKRALINEGIGEDVYGAFQTHLRQPIFSIVAKNVPESKKERFYEIIQTTLADTVKKGVPKELLNGALQVKEFALREGDFKGYSKGLLYFINAMKSWLYDSDPALYLKYEETLKALQHHKNTDYFEKLIEKYLIHNEHTAKVELYPEVGLDQVMEQQTLQKLSDIKAGWTAEQLKESVEATQKFNSFQQTPDSEEALHTIPLLKKEDLKKETMYPHYEIKEQGKNTYIVTPTFTNKIVYLNWYVKLDGIEDKYMPYLGMLVGMLGKLNTKEHSYEDLSTYMDETVGGMEYHIQAINNTREENAYTPVLFVKTKALYEKISEQVKIIREVLTKTLFDDDDRILEIIKEMKSIMEMHLSGEGHRVAQGRLLSHFSSAELFEEKTKGLTFYHFVCEIEKEWMTNKQEVVETLQQAYGYLNNKNKVVVGLTLDQELIEEAIPKIQTEIDSLEAQDIAPLAMKFELTDIQEALVYPGNVNYVAMGYNFKEEGFSYDGSMMMLKSILGMDYLWTNVRVKNGAYGCFGDLRKSGNMFFVSYRDPNVKQTLDIYKGIPQYLSNLNLSERELLQYLIGTISGLDFPYTPSTEGMSAQMHYFVGTTKEELQKSRDELFETDNEKLRSFAPIVKACLDKNEYCVFGNSTSIEETKDLFTRITTI